MIKATNAASATADAVIKATNAASATATAAVRAGATAPASLSAAVAVATAQGANLDAVISRALAATADLSAAVLAQRSATSSASSAVQADHAATATLEAAVQNARSAVVGLDSAIIQAHAGTASTDAAIRTSATAGVRAVERTPGVITTFPGGVAGSGSKAGSRYKFSIASTYEKFCPLLRDVPEANSQLPTGVASVMEIIMNGRDQQAIELATQAAIAASKKRMLSSTITFAMAPPTA